MWTPSLCLLLAYCVLPNPHRPFCQSPSDPYHLTLPSPPKTHLVPTCAHIPPLPAAAHLCVPCTNPIQAVTLYSHLRKRTKFELRQHQQSLEHVKNPYIGQTPWYAAGKSCPERKTQEHSRDFPHLARPHPRAGCEPLGSPGATGAGQGSLPLPPQHKPHSDLLVPHY